MSLPPLYAHRFGRDYGPDSSEQALARALAEPLAGLETDCCLTRDGAIVCLHEPYLPHATDGTGWVYERSAAEIAAGRLRDRNGEPTDQHPLLLEQLLDDTRIAGHVLQLEVKAFADPVRAAATARRVCRQVHESDRVPERTEIISFWPDACVVAAAEGLRSRLIVACAYTPEALAGWTGEVGITGVILEPQYFSRPVLDLWRAAGLSVMSGAVNDATLARIVAGFEPDAMATDRPHELARELIAQAQE
jgi:glycerophosphoryl diester phosphodiesterase